MTKGFGIFYYVNSGKLHAHMSMSAWGIHVAVGQYRGEYPMTKTSLCWDVHLRTYPFVGFDPQPPVTSRIDAMHISGIGDSCRSKNHQSCKSSMQPSITRTTKVLGCNSVERQANNPTKMVLQNQGMATKPCTTDPKLGKPGIRPVLRREHL